MSRTRIKDLERGGHTITVRDAFASLKAKGESILVYQYGSRFYRGKKVSLIVTDQSQYITWEDKRRCYH